jgi:dimethylargininase
MVIALTRAVPPSIDRCELTHLERTPIDYTRAVEEHDCYEGALRALGCRVERLPDSPEMPDSVFVEDTAVVFDDLAVIARPGAVSRRGEVAATIASLGRYRRLEFIRSPGTLDGGDVLVTPRRVFVGDTPRTNLDGARQLAGFIAPLGFELVRVPVTKCLHLKSAVSSLPAGSLLINPDWVDASYFGALDLVDVDSREAGAANVLAVGDRVLCAAEFPRTRALLEARGFITASVPAGELAKAEGGITCGSLVFRMNRSSQPGHS